MAKTLRINEQEEKLIQEKCIKINKILVNNNKAPMKDSEFVHYILKLTLENVQATKDGEIYIDI